MPVCQPSRLFLRHLALRACWLGLILGLGNLQAQPAPTKPPAPVLLPGEGLAITLDDEQVLTYGEVSREHPMGSLAKLLWMRLEGADWSGRGVQFKCTGKLGTFSCWNHQGHGRVDLAKALQESCNLAFLAWIADSQEHWKQDYGEAAGRARMEEVFGPFLGQRLPVGDTLPPLTPAWVGDGDLLRTSPEAFLRWLMDPGNAEVTSFGRRLLAGQWVDMKNLLGKESWWFKTGTAPVPGDPTATSAWVAGGCGPVLFVFHAPRGSGRMEGMTRVKAILGLKG